MKDLSIIIVNWNTKELLRNCINSIISETKKYSYDIWVVDNNSPDNSAEMIKNEFTEVKLIANKTNNGFAMANNQALEKAESEYLLLLNPDTLIINNAIDKMIEYMIANNNHVLTCKLLNEDFTLQKTVSDFFSFKKSFIENRFFSDILKNTNVRGEKLTNLWDHNSLREIDWAHGAVLLMSNKAFRDTGLLDENFFIYAEEMDYYKRLRKAGYIAIFHPDIKIVHYGKSSSRQKRAEMFIQNYKSFYLFLKKHYPGYIYILYRIRTLLYLNIWMLKYSAELIVKTLLNRNSDEAKVQMKVYSKTFLWHLKSESFIAI